MKNLKEVFINGYKYYFNSDNKTLYEDKEQNNPISFLFMTKDEKRQLDNEIDYPRDNK
jgi:hypothetical protein